MRLNVTVAKNYPAFLTRGTPPCATTDPEIFFPEKGARGQDQYTVNSARKICGSCEYKTECLAWAVEHNEMGIWGGMTAQQRRPLVTAFNKAKNQKAA